MSFWFRVPQASLDAGAQDFIDRSGGNDLQMVGIIPVITFGKTGQYEVISDPADSFTSLTGPSFIGVFCTGADRPPGKGFFLAARIQYPELGPDLNPPSSPTSERLSDFFQIGPVQDGSISLGGPAQTASFIDVAPDQWHHVLASFDMSNGCDPVQPSFDGSQIAFGRTCRFWLAYDDENRAGDYLTPYGEQCYAPFTGNPNGVVSAYSIDPAGPGFEARPVPTNGEPVALPSSNTYPPSVVNFVYACEMAELQFFSDVTLDTSVESNRRAFVDANGKPVDPVRTPDDPSDSTPDDPTDPNSAWHTPAERLLGKKPIILLHGSNNWINGVNTGPLFVPDPASPDPANPRPIPDPAVALTPTGQITAFSPGPSLQRSTPPALLREGRLQPRIAGTR
jgi:hypothetical protein